MGKSKYKPRIVEFNGISFGIVKIDTRKGKDGYYPGDETMHSFHSAGKCRVIILGVCVHARNKANIGKLFYSTKEEIVFSSFGGGYRLRKSKCITRHGQHLIDSGEMIQVED